MKATILTGGLQAQAVKVSHKAISITNVTEDECFRFFNKVNKTDGCWIWTGKIGTDGYGRFKISAHKWKLTVHRISYFIHNKFINSNLLVRHSCDNPVCVNPEHLSQGTNEDNMRDMAIKDRGRTRFPKPKYKGICPIKNKYLAYVCYKSKKIDVGKFDTLEMAVTARNNYIDNNNLPLIKNVYENN